MEQPVDRVKQILTLLGPGLWLEVDSAAFPIFFGSDLGRETAEIEADRFAKQNGCTVIIDRQGAKFGRAYAKGSNHDLAQKSDA